MNYKIIKTESICPDVLLCRCPFSYENGDNICLILVYGQIENDFCMVKEEISFESSKSLEDFIQFYTKKQAINFCKEHNMLY